MVKVRQPTVAGMFYPADPAELGMMVENMLNQATVADIVPKALIVPHAGYIYSGPIAASGYALLDSIKHLVRKVVLLGPSHRVGFRGLSVSSADFFATPLGTVPIDKASIKKILELGFVQTIDQAHTQEHSLEVHLPFLQKTLGAFSLVPIVAGNAPPEQVCEVLELLWGDNETLIVISSDLSHYHDYDTARRMDRETSEAIETFQWQSIDNESACGRVGVNGLLLAAQRHHLNIETIDLRNSGDTAGSKDQVVGYGTYVIA